MECRPTCLFHGGETWIGTSYATNGVQTTAPIHEVVFFRFTQQDGSPGDDWCNGMAVGPDERVVLAGETDGPWGGTVTADDGGDFVAIALEMPTMPTQAPSAAPTPAPTPRITPSATPAPTPAPTPDSTPAATPAPALGKVSMF